MVMELSQSLKWDMDLWLGALTEEQSQLQVQSIFINENKESLIQISSYTVITILEEKTINRYNGVVGGL